MLNILSNVETSLYEIEMLNYKYENILLRNFHLVGTSYLYVLLEIMNPLYHMEIRNLDIKTV